MTRRGLLKGDPLPWLLEPEGPARYWTLRDLLGRPSFDMGQAGQPNKWPRLLLDFIRSGWDRVRYLVEQTAQTLNRFCRYERDPQMVFYVK